MDFYNDVLLFKEMQVKHQGNMNETITTKKNNIKGDENNNNEEITRPNNLFII